MPSFGETLRRERESRKIPLHEISLATRISEGHLEALESADLKALPGTVFNKGYVRAYAEYLEIDPEPLLEAYEAEESAQARRGQVPESPDVLEALRRSVDRGGASGRRQGPSAGLIVGVLTAVVVVVGGWLLGRDLLSGDAGSESDPGSAAAAAAPTTGPGQTDAPSERAPIREAAGRSPDRAGGTTDLPAERAEPSAPAELPDTAPAKPDPAKDATPPAPARPKAAPDRASPASAPVRSPVRTTTPPAPEPAPRPAVESEGSALAIPDHGVGTAIIDRNLSGRSDRFAPGTEIFFWTRVTGGAGGDVIRHVWLHEGEAVGSVSLRIGGSHWRTNSRRVISATGAWAVEARDEDGRVLAREEFVCR